MRARAGGASTYQICLRPSADRIVLRLGSPFDYGARGFNVNTLLPLVEFSKGDANQKLPFLFSPFGGGVGGGAVQRNGRKFLGLPRASSHAPRRVPAQSERTKNSQATTHAARAKSVALRLEIGSSGAVYFHNLLLKERSLSR